MFICYFSTNKNDTLFSIASLNSPSNSTSTRCLTLLRSMECSSRLEILKFLAPVMVKKTTPPPRKLQVNFKKSTSTYAHINYALRAYSHSKLRSGTSCQIIRVPFPSPTVVPLQSLAEQLKGHLKKSTTISLLFIRPFQKKSNFSIFFIIVPQEEEEEEREI